MKKSRFTDSRIIAVLKQAGTGTPVRELCCERGISSATLYKWRSRLDCMDASLMSQLKEAPPCDSLCIQHTTASRIQRQATGNVCTAPV